MTTTNEVWKIIGNVPIGVVFTWCVAIIAIISAIVKGINSLYTYFNKYKQLKDDNDKQSQMLKNHEIVLDDIRSSLNKISASLDEQKDINMKYVRHIIVDSCYKAIISKEIQIEQLASLEEMYKEYVDIFNGNSYVTCLVDRVRELPIVGKIEET